MRAQGRSARAQRNNETLEIHGVGDEQRPTARGTPLDLRKKHVRRAHAFAILPDIRDRHNFTSSRFRNNVSRPVKSRLFRKVGWYRSKAIRPATRRAVFLRNSHLLAAEHYFAHDLCFRAFAFRAFVIPPLAIWLRPAAALVYLVSSGRLPQNERRFGTWNGAAMPCGAKKFLQFAAAWRKIVR